MIKDRKTLVLYSVPELDETYKTNYFLDFTKKVFPDVNQLKEIKIYTLESEFNLNRIIDTVKKVIVEFPRMNTITFSYTINNIEEVINFYKALPEDKQIKVNININNNILDYQSQKAIDLKNNFKLLLEQLIEFKNINTIFTNETVLDIESIITLQDEKSVVDYFKFIEDLYLVGKDIYNSNIKFNFRTPVVDYTQPITCEVGRKFATFCRLCTEIESKNLFSYYKHITPYAKANPLIKREYTNKAIYSFKRVEIGLLPDDFISICHNEITTLIKDFAGYKNDNYKTIIEYFKLETFEKLYEYYYTDGHNNGIEALVGEIQLYSYAKKINTLFQDHELAKQVAVSLGQHFQLSVQNNNNKTATKILIYPGIIKLMLNGAEEYILDDRYREI